MVIHLLLLSLLQFLLLASGGPCNLKFKAVLVRSPNDESGNNYVEIEPFHQIKRLSNSENVMYQWNDYFSVYYSQGSCAKDSSLQRVIWNENKDFQDCGGEFELWTTGIEKDWHAGNQNDQLWDFRKKFYCDGVEFSELLCNNVEESGVVVNYTCTNHWAWSQLFPAEKTYLEKEKIEKNNFENIQERYNELTQKLYGSGLNHENQINDCDTQKDWKIYDICKNISFIRPIYGVLSSFGNTPNPELAKFLDPDFVGRFDWKTVTKEMIDLTKAAFSKDRPDAATPLTTNLFTREMVYTVIHRAEEEVFKWNDSPLSRYAKEWYEFAKSANNDELQKIFALPVEDRVKKFCEAETEKGLKSLLCSFIVAKNKYDHSQIYFTYPCPAGVTTTSEQLQLKCSNLTNISPYFGGEHGMYASFNQELKRFVDKSTLIDQFGKLGSRLKEYHTALATFDNKIAQADVGYLQGAIKKNTDRLLTNAKNMGTVVEQLKQDKEICQGLNMFEGVLKIAVSVGIMVATAGAIPPNPKTIADGVGDFIDAAKDAITVTTDLTTQIVTQSNFGEEVDKYSQSAKTGINGLIEKLNNNKDKIEEMHQIQQAVMDPDRNSLKAIKPKIDNFLVKYNTYEPAITKTDIVELNTNYSNMLDSLEKSFESPGFLCGIAIGGRAKARVNEAKGVWAAIISLLEDIHGQQFELITAIVKVIRSRLDESAAQVFEPDVNYDFEIIVGHLLNVRVAAQGVCNTYQYLYNDVQDNQACIDMRSKVFLLDDTRNKIEGIFNSLTTTVLKPDSETNGYYALIPVTVDYKNRHSIRWDDLINGTSVEFQLPANDSKFLSDNRWIISEDAANRQLGLVKSLEIFFPTNIPGIDNSQRRPVEFSVHAIQENVTVNARYEVRDNIKHSIGLRYAVNGTLTATSSYILNESPCDTTLVENFYEKDGPKYCIPNVSGRFGNPYNLPVPVSLYSRFQIRLIDGYKLDIEKLREFRPFGTTLSLRARIRMIPTPGGDQGRQRTRKPPANIKPPETEYCGDGKYRQVIGEKSECVDCPEGSVPVARGSYCVAKK